MAHISHRDRRVRTEGGVKMETIIKDNKWYHWKLDKSKLPSRMGAPLTRSILDELDPEKTRKLEEDMQRIAGPAHATGFVNDPPADE